MPSLYQMKHEPEVEQLLEDLRKKLWATGAGVTLNGNRVTLRWHLDGQLVSAHMILESVTTPSESRDADRQMKEMRGLLAKYAKKAPDLEAELFHIEHGEWPQ